MSNGKLLTLRVVDSAGQPVENARVMLESAPVPVPDIAAMSDDEGRVIIPLPATGSYSIGCFADGYAAGHFEIDAVGEDVVETIVLEDAG